MARPVKDTNTTVENTTKNDEIDLMMRRVQEIEAVIASLKKEEVKTNHLIGERIDSTLESCLLPGRKIKIVPVKKAPNSLIKDADEATMLRGSGKSITVPLSKTGELVNPLTEKEKVYLEDVLGLDLNVYSKDTFFTKKDAQIRFKKTGRTIESATVELNLGDAFNYLLWKIALSSPRVANNWADRKHPRCEFVIKDDNQVLAEKISLSDKEDFVLEYLLKNKTNKKALYDLLRLYGNSNRLANSVKRTNSVEWLYTQVKEINSNSKGLNELFTIITKLSESNSSRLILIMDALECGALEKIANEYRINGSPIGHSIEDVTLFLNNKENSVIVLRIQKQVDDYLKNI